MLRYLPENRNWSNIQIKKKKLSSSLYKKVQNCKKKLIAECSAKDRVPPPPLPPQVSYRANLWV